MSKLVKFLVTIGETQQEADTAKEVSRLLDRKVTRAAIVAGEVPEVTVIDTEEDIPSNTEVEEASKVEAIVEESKPVSEGEDIMNNDNGTYRVKLPNGEYKHEPLFDPLHRDIAITEEEQVEQEIQEILDGANPEEEDMDNDEDMIEDSTEDNSENIDDTEDDNENIDDNEEDSTGKTKMELLMEKMRKLNASKAPQDKVDTKKSKKTDANAYIEQNGYPEVGYFTEEKALKKFYKQLSDTQLDEWLELEGLTYKSSDNEPINRMRKCMAILYLHFPRETKSTSKSKSKYADYTTEALLQMALDNDIYVKDAKGDARILRMYCIMELKKAGLL